VCKDVADAIGAYTMNDTTERDHYHIHDEDGECLGDLVKPESAWIVAAEYTYPWSRVDGTPLDQIVTVVVVPFCVEQCRGVSLW
jgi:hypothetical protein